MLRELLYLPFCLKTAQFREEQVNVRIEVNREKTGLIGAESEFCQHGFSFKKAPVA